LAEGRPNICSECGKLTYLGRGKFLVMESQQKEIKGRFHF